MENVPCSDLAASNWTDGGSYFNGTSHDASCVVGNVASAIDYLHSKGMIHNDIKPANILYDRERGPVLIDFGLQTQFRDRPCIAGTPWYVAPEVLSKKSRGPESDIFALGIVALYLLRKIALPEQTKSHPSWRISDIHKDPKNMNLWLEYIIEIQHNLAPTGLESIVKGALIVLPQGRISAQDIMARHHALLLPLHYSGTRSSHAWRTEDCQLLPDNM